MAWKPIEKWLDLGWSPVRIVYSAVAAVTVGVTVYGYVSHPHHPGALWYLLGAVAVLALWAVTEMLRWRVRHNRLERRIAAVRPGPTDPDGSSGSPAAPVVTSVRPEAFVSPRDVAQPQLAV